MNESQQIKNAKPIVKLLEAVRGVVDRDVGLGLYERKARAHGHRDRHLASKLIELDRDTARGLHDLLWKDERHSIPRPTCALARGLGIDEGDDPEADDGIPECLGHAPKAVTP